MKAIFFLLVIPYILSAMELNTTLNTETGSFNEPELTLLSPGWFEAKRFYRASSDTLKVDLTYQAIIVLHNSYSTETIFKVLKKSLDAVFLKTIQGYIISNWENVRVEDKSLGNFKITIKNKKVSKDDPVTKFYAQTFVNTLGSINLTDLDIKKCARVSYKNGAATFKKLSIHYKNKQGFKSRVIFEAKPAASYCLQEINILQ